MPYGSHPCQMPQRYYFDEDHIRGVAGAARRPPKGAKAYFHKYVFGVADFNAYLEKIGGLKRLRYLRQVEELRVVQMREQGHEHSLDVIRACQR